MVRKGLGRGLTALLGDKAAATLPPPPVVETVREPEVQVTSGPLPTVRLDRIVPNPYQPRLEMDPGSLVELAASIRVHGLLEPPIVRRHPNDPNLYQLIAGERRMRASTIAGLEEIPVQVRDSSDEELLEIALVENIQRENLNPIDEARGYRLLLEGGTHGGVSLTQQEVGDRVGKSRTVIANLLRLLDLPEAIQTAIQAGEISQGHGKVLAGLEDELRQAAFTHTVRTQCSVRELEAFVRNQTKAPKAGAKPARKETTKELDPHWKSIQEALQERLRTKVLVHPGKDGAGSLEVQFFSDEDLDRLLESLDIDLG